MIRSVLKIVPLLVFVLVHWLANSLNYNLGHLFYEVNKNNSVFDIGQYVIPETHHKAVSLLNRVFYIAPVILSPILLPIGMLYEFLYMMIVLRLVGMALATVTVFPPTKQPYDDFFFSAFVLFSLMLYSAGIGSSVLLSGLAILYGITIVALRQNYTSTLVFGAVVASTVYQLFKY